MLLPSLTSLAMAMKTAAFLLRLMFTVLTLSTLALLVTELT